jgi:hypothetical protein
MTDNTDELMEAFINPSMNGFNEGSSTDDKFVEINQEAPGSSKPDWKIGDMFKITGGKFKKYKTCQLFKINPTYSDVCIQSTDCKKGTTAPLNSLHSKVKNCYLHPLETGPIIEMPTMDDCVVVDALPDWQAPATTVEDLPQQNTHLLQDILDGEVGSNGGDLEVDEQTGEITENITEFLPSIQEALDLRNEVRKLKDLLRIEASSIAGYEKKLKEMETTNGEMEFKKLNLIKCIIDL